MSYSELEQQFRRLNQLDHISAILDWDQAVIMPPRAGGVRAEAMATLQGLRHELATQPRLGELLAKAMSQSGGLDAWQAANLREMSRHYRRATAVSQQLVEASSRAEAQSEQAWRVLRAQNDWRSFLPLFDQVVKLKREVAASLSDVLGCSRYDALLDGYESGLSAKVIDRLFGELKAVLPTFLPQAMARQQSETLRVPKGPFDPAAQKRLGEELMVAVGFDASIGRLDVSHHPFCGGVPRDVRITTRYNPDDFTSALMGVLHEAGHAKYEQGLPDAWLEQPVGMSRGMMTHEGQSLFTEMFVARSPSFTEFMAPYIARAFPEQVKREPYAFSANNLYLLQTRIRPGFIRVDADEVTYPSHIIVRYEIERALIEGSIDAKDVPELWDASMQSLLGLSTQGNDRDGAMQDVHWPSGAFGYFPLYTLGALMAAQLYEAASTQMADLSQQVRRGEFAQLNFWLSERVWSKASLLSSAELVEHATGEALTSRPFLAHLERRYLDREG